jgi:integrase
VDVQLTALKLLRARDTPLSVRLRLAAAKLPAAVPGLKKQRAQPKYDCFYEVAPLWDAAVRLTASDSLNAVRTGTIVMLKLTTFMRSADVANCLPSLFCHMGDIFIRTVAKGDIGRSFTVKGAVLEGLVRWCLLTKTAATLTLFTHLPDARLSLGSERIAKISLALMGECGVQTSLFKAHSLRGAAATAALLRGTDATFVRERGGWADGPTFQRHYGRAHQHMDWAPSCAALRGTDVGTHVVFSNLVSPEPPLLPKGSRTEPTKEGGVRESEVGGGFR